MINPYRMTMGLLNPSNQMDTAERVKNQTITRGNPQRSPNQPPMMAPKIPPKFSANKNDKLEPRLLPAFAMSLGNQEPNAYTINKQQKNANQIINVPTKRPSLNKSNTGTALTFASS